MKFVIWQNYLQILTNVVKVHLCVTPMPSAPIRWDCTPAHVSLVTLAMATYVLVSHMTSQSIVQWQYRYEVTVWGGGGGGVDRYHITSMNSSTVVNFVYT